MNTETFKTRLMPYADLIYRISLRMVGNAAEAQDVVQDVLIKLWKKRSELDGIHNLEAWVVRITRNRCIDGLRSRNGKWQEIDPQMAVVASAPTPLEQAEQTDTMARIRGFIGQLPENQQLVIQLRDVEGLSYQEIADALDMPMSQVKINLFRARQKLKTKLIESESYGLSTH